MRIKALACTTALALLAAFTPALAKAPAAGAKVTAPRIAYSRWVLSNGLTVIAIPDSATSTVTTSVWYTVGAKHDPEGRAGFAHLFEHILSRADISRPSSPRAHALQQGLSSAHVRRAAAWADLLSHHQAHRTPPPGDTGGARRALDPCGQFAMPDHAIPAFGLLTRVGRRQERADFDDTRLLTKLRQGSSVVGVLVRSFLAKDLVLDQKDRPRRKDEQVRHARRLRPIRPPSLPKPNARCAPK